MFLHAGFVGLVEFDRFDHQYRTAIDVLATRYRLDADVSKHEMEAAFHQWIRGYFHITLHQDLAERPSLLRGIRVLVEALGQHRIVSYRQPDEFAAMDQITRALIAMPDVGTALVFGAEHYCLEVRRRQKTEPECLLRPHDIAAAAGEVSKDIKVLRRLPRLLKLKKVRTIKK